MLIAGEDHATAGGEGTADHRVVVAIAPFDLAAGRIDGGQMAIGLTERREGIAEAAAKGRIAWMHAGLFLGERHAALDNWHEHGLGDRAIGVGGRAIVAAYRTGTDHLDQPVNSRHELRIDARPAIGIEPRGPVQILDVLGTAQKLAAAGVEQIHIAIAIGLRDGTQLFAVLFDIDQDQAIGRVVVPHIMRRGLKVPAQLTAVSVERKHRITVEVVTLARIAVEQRRRIAGRPIEQIAGGVIGAGHPGRRTTALPGLTRPAVGMLLTGLRHGVTTPAFLAGLKIIGGDKTPCRKFAAAIADDDLVLHHQRRAGGAEAELVVGHLGVPQQLAGGTFKGQQARIQGRHENLVAGDRNATVGRAAAQAQVARHLMLVVPFHIATDGIETIEIIVCSGEEQHAVGNHRRACHLALHTSLKHPCRREPSDVVARDVG